MKFIIAKITIFAKKILEMETVIIKARTKSDARFLMDFSKRIGADAKIINTEELEDIHLASLIEQGLKTPSVSRDEVMNALKQ